MKKKKVPVECREKGGCDEAGIDKEDEEVEEHHRICRRASKNLGGQDRKSAKPTSENGSNCKGIMVISPERETHGCNVET
ncbi:hypothetical protein RIF29_25965 [Crotalaria pallida]|uniref:Uncharacterized protein n=1 Tax=Crotalaria pallida TaxID=3830 RepID=A0AAN9EMU1_CROPI